MMSRLARTARAWCATLLLTLLAVCGASGVVTAVPTTTALTSDPNPSGFGAKVTLTASVAPETASGTVEFFDGAAPLGTASLSGGAAVLSVTALAVGEHSLTARYGGDPGHDPSVSPAVVHVVGRAASAVALEVSPPKSTCAEDVTLRAAVTPPGATGIVEFFDGGLSLGTALIDAAGTATRSVSGLPLGPHALRAEYRGDANFSGATSPTVAHDVNRAPSAVLLEAPAFSSCGDNVVLRATVTPPGATGVVEFFVGGISLGTRTLGPDGRAEAVAAGLPVGVHSLSVSYRGDACRMPAVSDPLPHEVRRAASVVALEAPAASSCGDNLILRATVTPAGATGIVEFFVGGVSAGTRTLDPAGTAQITVGGLPVGSHSFGAEYRGDACVAPGAAAKVVHEVRRRATVVELEAPVASGCNEGVTLRATVVPAGATGSVEFLDGVVSLGIRTLEPTGVAVLQVSGLEVGPHVLTARYGGDGCHEPAASGPVDHQVRTVPSATGLSVAPTSTCGQDVILRATVTPAGRGGTVEFFDGTTSVAVRPLGETGIVEAPASGLSVGLHALSARYSGDGCRLASGSDEAGHEVFEIPASVALEAPVRSTCGEDVVLRATLTPAGATGTVEFLDGAASVARRPVDATGVVVVVATGLLPGAHSFTVTYSGDFCHPPAVSPKTDHVVDPLPTVTRLEASPSRSACGEEVRLRATVEPATAAGFVRFFAGADPVGPAVAVAGGVAELSTAALAVGVHSLTARYGGAGCDGPSVSDPVVHEVARAASATTLAVDPAKSRLGEPVTLRASLAPAAAGGTVEFFDGAVSLGPPVALAGGVAELSVASLDAGTHAFTARYGGDDCHEPSASEPVVHSVNRLAAAIGLAVDPAGSRCGEKVTVTATLVPAEATGSVEFFDGASSLGPPVAVTGGTAALSASALAVGRHLLSARYGGDARFEPAASDSVTHDVSLAGSSVALTAEPAKIHFGETVTLRATLSPRAATGSVEFFSGASSLGPPAEVMDGAAELAVASLDVGSHLLSARYSGDACRAPGASGDVAYEVNRGATHVAVDVEPRKSSWGAKVTIRATVTPPGAVGTVRFSDGPDPLTLPLPIVDGTVEISITTLDVGVHRLVAHYGGERRYEPSVSTPVALEVNPAETATALDSDVNPAKSGTEVALRATVDPSTATGTVDFLDGGVPIGSRSVEAGAATLRVSDLAPGSHEITAVYRGDRRHLASVSPPLVQVVIEDQAPRVLVERPNGGEILLVGMPAELAWAASDDHGVTAVDLLVSRDRGATYQAIASGIPNTGTFTWMVTGPGTNVGPEPVFSALLQVRARDRSGNVGADASDAPFALFDLATDALLSEFSARTVEAGVEVRWRARPGLLAVTGLERAEAAGGPWHPLAAERQNDGEVTVAVDRGVSPGRTYHYRLRAVAAAGGALTFDPVSAVAGSPVGEFALSAPAPNPSAGVARLEFSVAREARVRVAVHDVMGRELAVLADGVYPPGLHPVVWNGETDRGPAPVGLYLVRYHVAGRSLTRRLVLAR